jgi:hypothetical protein
MLVTRGGDQMNIAAHKLRSAISIEMHWAAQKLEIEIRMISR